MEPICIVPAGDLCGEAATWDASANCLTGPISIDFFFTSMMRDHVQRARIYSMSPW